MRDITDIQSDANWGFMLSQFKWVYAFLSPFGGFVADRFSKRWTIVVSLFCWSVVTWLTGQVETYEQLKWTRALMGISEAFYIPAALALIANFHTGSTRSKAIGVHQTAIYFGLILGGFGGYAADARNDGWRLAFSVAGGFGIFYALLLPFILRDARVSTTDFGTHSSNRDWRSMTRELFLNPSYWLLVCCFTLPAIAGWIVKDWMPAILENRFSISQGKAGVSATLYVNLAALVGVFIGGLAADAWAMKNIRGRIYISGLGMLLMIPALLGLGNSSSLLIAVVFLITFGIGWGFFDCNNMPILSQIVVPEWRATGYGFMNFVSITGGGFADWGFGVLSDRNTPLNITFGVFALVALGSIVLVLLIRPRPELTQQLKVGNSQSL